MQFSSSEVVGHISCSWDDMTSSTTGTFPPTFSETATKDWYRKLLDKINEKFWLKCLCDRLICFADFVEKTLLALRFQLPPPNCFLKVCLPTLYADVLIFFLRLTTSSISGTANSNKSAATRFAAGTMFSRKNGIAVLPISCASLSNPRPRCRPTPL